MARSSPATSDIKPDKAIRYSLPAWFTDRHTGRGDGYAGIPACPAGPDTGLRAVTTPYLEIRGREFRDRAEHERRRILSDLEPVYCQLGAVREDIAGGEERIAEIRLRLDAIPKKLDEDALTWRNVVEQHIPEELVRARRQREHDARRGEVHAELDRAAAKVRGLRVEEARLVKMIITREQILATRVRQLHEHTLRRCGTYKHHLVRKHADGQALIPFLDLATPTLPDWLPRHDLGTGPTGPAPGPRLVA